MVMYLTEFKIFKEKPQTKNKKNKIPFIWCNPISTNNRVHLYYITWSFHFRFAFYNIYNLINIIRLDTLICPLRLLLMDLTKPHTKAKSSDLSNMCNIFWFTLMLRDKLPTDWLKWLYMTLNGDLCAVNSMC